MNPNSQGPVQLAGRGYVFRHRGHFEPGEYAELINVDLTNRGTLKSRPPASAYYLESGTQYEMTRIAGLHGSGLLVSSVQGRAPYFTRTNSKLPWDTAGFGTWQNNLLAVRPTAGTDGGVTSDVRLTLLAFFIYNSIEYAVSQITYRPGGTDNSVAYVVVSSAPQISALNPNLWSAHTVGGVVVSFTEVGVYTNKATYYTNNPRISQFIINDWEVHKDRLWLALNDIVYFSKATDPKVWTVPDGGFFKFPNQSIKSVKSLGDVLYIIGDSSVHTLVYATDPNTDPELTVISTVIGGEDATILGDTIYMVKPNAIYAVNGNNVSKVTDLEIYIPATDVLILKHDGTTFTDTGTFSLQIEAFEESLFIIPRVIRQVSGSTSPWDVKYAKIHERSVGSNIIITGIYRYFTDLQFLTRYDFGSNGEAVDARFSSTEDILNQTKIYFLGSVNYEEVYNISSMGNRSRYPDQPLNALAPVFQGISQYTGMDTITDFNVVGSLKAEHPRYRIAIHNWTPDDMQHLYRKFRSVEIDLTVPLKYDEGTNTYNPCLNFDVFCGDDSGGYVSVNAGVGGSLDVMIDSYMSADSRITDYPDFAETHRYGINQRGKRMAFVFSCEPRSFTDLEPSAPELTDYFIRSPIFEIADIRVLWSYLNRGSVNASIGP